MQKIGMVIVLTGILWSGFFVNAEATNEKKNQSTTFQPATLSIKELSDTLYHQIDFNNETPLAPEVFEKAFTGFMNLKAAGRLPTDETLLSVCDFSLSSNQKRLWVIDLESKKVLFHTLVAHGMGTGEEFATRFSNRINSHQSSLGFYITEGTYMGNNGYSLRLTGMDPGYNDRASERAIVMHGADYVCQSFIKNHRRLGRSWGCPAVPTALARPIIDKIKDQSCLFIYYPDEQYLTASQWLQTERHPNLNNELSKQLQLAANQPSSEATIAQNDAATPDISSENAAIENSANIPQYGSVRLAIPATE